MLLVFIVPTAKLDEIYYYRSVKTVCIYIIYILYILFHKLKCSLLYSLSLTNAISPTVKEKETRCFNRKDFLSFTVEVQVLVTNAPL